jgi:hypothetical protein
MTPTRRLGCDLPHSRWRRDVANVDRDVEHGYDYPPLRIKDAAMLLAYNRA